MRKIEAYLDWLHQGWEVRSLTMNELRCALGTSAPRPRPAAACDWTTGRE